MARGIEGDHILQAEVPLEVRVEEGHHEGARSTIDVDLDVPAVLFVQLACTAAQGSGVSHFPEFYPKANMISP